MHQQLKLDGTSPMAAVARSFDVARSYLGSFSWSPLVHLSRAAVLSVLGRVEIGHIAIVDSDGSETICGERWRKEGVPATELTVLKEAFWVRLLLFADMVRALNYRPLEGESAKSDRRGFRDSQKASCWVR